MTLIKSISGIRGTIGGRVGEGLTPIDVVKFAAAYGTWIKGRSVSNKIVIGRDARISGPLVNQLVSQTLISLGWDVVDLGLSTTPTVELAVPQLKAAGGIILTASHNPKQWNALKLLNDQGEFISATDGQELLEIAENSDFEFVDIDSLGEITFDSTYIDQHVQHVLDLDLVNVAAIKQADFSIAVDAVNSSGGVAVPALLEALGVTKIEKIFCEPNGHFPHNPEPLPENIVDLSNIIRKKGCDLGIVVDPDVDRLAFVCEDGVPFGEEYTLVAVADYVLSKTKGGNTVSNLSSTRALRDVTVKHGGTYHAAAVGEVNVVNQMKSTNAVIGGEGNGGIIYPDSHYGRDALVGIGLFLSLLAERKLKMTALKASYPYYHISKNKIQLNPEMDVDLILRKVENSFRGQEVRISTIDGVKIDFPQEWVHLRKSNTEPIIRIYAESNSEANADELAQKMIAEIKKHF